MPNKRYFWLLLLVLVLTPCLSPADIILDGVDDDLVSGLALSTFMSATTGTMLLWYRPTGIPNWSDPAGCFNAERTMGNFTSIDGSYVGFSRHGNLGGLDVLTAWLWDGDEDCLTTAYANDVWTHLAWVHSGGVLTFVKDGVVIGTDPSAGAISLMTGTVRLGTGAGAVEDYRVGQGVVAEAQLADHAIPIAEIQALAHGKVHHLGRSTRTARWAFDTCATTGAGVVFYDRSGNGRALTGDQGPNTTGLTCLPNTILVYPAWVD